jgi:hypothetical protein
MNVDRSILTKIFSPIVILAGLVFGCLLVFFLVVALSFTRPQSPRTALGTAIIQVIEAPTHTPVLPTLPPTETSTPEPGTPLPPPQGVINIGAIVSVRGTGTDGLRIRDQPGLQGKILFVAIESEVFRVADGPQEADGYTWWQLVSPFDESVQGWAVSNYLGIEQNP